MSVNTAESENAQPVAHKPASELIYRLEDRPPLPQTLFAAFQHLLAMFVAVITPALLICQALGLPAQDTQHIISMSLFASGVASIIQIKAWGPVGSGLLSIQGTSFNFVAPLIMGGTALKTGGADVPTMMAALFGTLMLASCTEMVLSRILHLARRIITPLVSGVVVMIIGLSLIQVGLTSIGGGYAAMADHTFGAPKNLLLAGIVLDTKNFTMRTGGRTFEAAAFLRRAGADTSDVQRLFQSDLAGMVERYDIIRHAELVHGDIAVAAVEKEIDRVTAAKAADELLTLSGIHASFVLFKNGTGVNLSARSLGEINVQFIMEKLGGGGNSTTAGGQVADASVDEVRARLLNAIDEYMEE